MTRVNASPRMGVSRVNKLRGLQSQHDICTHFLGCNISAELISNLYVNREVKVIVTIMTIALETQHNVSHNSKTIHIKWSRHYTKTC